MTPDGLGPNDPTHNPKVAGSNPAPATKESAGQGRCGSTGPSVSRDEIPSQSLERQAIPTIGFVRGTKRQRKPGVWELRVYVGNDPLNGTDPSGLCASGKVTDNNGTCVLKANLKSDNAKIAAYAASENALIAKIQAEAAASASSSNDSSSSTPTTDGPPAPNVTPTTASVANPTSSPTAKSTTVVGGPGGGPNAPTGANGIVHVLGGCVTGGIGTGLLFGWIPVVGEFVVGIAGVGCFIGGVAGMKENQ